MSEPVEPIIEFAPWDGRRVPVTLLGGYLGAGKTTAINELLARTDRPIAVMVNDVGAVNIDAALIARRHGDTIELTDGCICCSLAEGLAEAFAGLRRRATPPDQVVVELSGVADPTRVIPWARSTGFRLDGVVVLVDAERFVEQVDDPIIGSTLNRQLSAADLVLITKTDLVEPEAGAAVETRLERSAPSVPVLTSSSAMAAAAFLNIGTRAVGGVDDVPTPTLFDPHVTTMLPLSDPISLDELEGVLDGLGPGVLRAKGIVTDHDGHRHLVQVVGRRRTITPLPFAEEQPATDLVVISARQ